MNHYDVIARFYDHFRDDRDTALELTRIEADLQRWSPRFEPPLRVLDLGCGTGLFSLALAEAGHQVLGIDLSGGMLGAAAAKIDAASAEVRQRLELREADLRSFEPDEPFDLVLALTDTFNHITPDELRGMGERLARMLKPGGLLIFDILTADFLRNERGDRCFQAAWPEESDEPDCGMVWKNHWDEERQTAFCEFTFYIRDGEGYLREEDEVTEYAHNVPFLLEVWAPWLICLERSEREGRERFVLQPSSGGSSRYTEIYPPEELDQIYPVD